MGDASCFHNLHEGGILRELAAGVRARVFPGVNAMLSVVTLEPHSVSPVHAHANEQWGVCLEGEWIRIQDGVEHTVKAGDFWQTPPHVPHGGRTLESRCVVLDIFAPPREEYRQAGAGLGVLTSDDDSHHVMKRKERSFPASVLSRITPLLPLIVLIGIPLSAAAGTQAPAPPAGLSLYGQSWAVVVGVDRFKQRTVSRLNYAANDARSVAKALVPLGFPEKNITMLLNEQATRGEIERVLSSAIRRAAGPNDRLVIFFATHGVTLSLPGGGEEGYLLPHDGDPDDLPLTALAMQQLKQIGQRIAAKHILIAVDACYGGLSLLRAQAPSVVDRRYLELVGRSRVMQVLTAGRKDEPVIEDRGHGVFTRALLDGLEGHADENHDGLITLSELGAWMHPRVAQASDYKQDMQWGSLDGEGQFVFVLPPAPPAPVTLAPARPPAEAPRVPPPPRPSAPPLPPAPVAPAPAPPPAIAAIPPAKGPGDALVGTWEGSINSEFSRGTVRLVITRSGDGLEGTLVLGSVTAEGRAFGVGLPESLALSRHIGSRLLTRVRISDRVVGFVAAGPPEDLAVNAELSRNGRALTGATRTGGFTYELRLQRK